MTTAIDALSVRRLASGGLQMALVDTSDTDALRNWFNAESRGFHEGQASPEKIAVILPYLVERRTTGVFDESGVIPTSPVATISSWPMNFTLPGDCSIPAWSISSVTVSPTHRRRGIARSMLEAELRTAHSLGYAVAILTVTEATIYARYGFGPTVMAADWTINTERARWIGPVPLGRVQFTTAEDLLLDGHELVKQAVLDTPGEVEFSGLLWERVLVREGDPESARQRRIVRYDDADGDLTGFAVYRVKENDTDFTRHTLELEYLVTTTDDAYAGLWSYLLEVDLVSTILAPLRSVNETMAWQISDYRAARQSSVRDHLWSRLLDVPAALSARQYSAPGRFVLDVSDGLGFADGLFLVSIDGNGSAAVELLETEAPDDAFALALEVAELSSLYLGAVSALTLVRAGRVTELRPGSAAAFDTAFRPNVTPWMSIGF